MGNNRLPRRHGTISEYSNHGCNKSENCPNYNTDELTCSEAWAQYYRNKRGGSLPKNATPKYGIPASTNNRTPGTEETNDFGFTRTGDDAIQRMMRELWGPAEDSGDRTS